MTTGTPGAAEPPGAAAASAAAAPAAGIVVVVAKVPRPGRCKTRLVPLLGPDGAAHLATAMLQDVVASLNEVACQKVLLYAPATDDAEAELVRLLGERGDPKDDNRALLLEPSWNLIPLPESDPTNPNLTGPLSSAARLLMQKWPSAPSVVWVGADAPELPLDEVKAALSVSPGSALLCPAADGGYGLLGVSTALRLEDGDGGQSDDPSPPPVRCFDGVLWSHPLTALSQIKACRRAGLTDLRLGRLISDVDDASDVRSLCARLRSERRRRRPVNADPAAANPPEHGCLDLPSFGDADAEIGPCAHTRRALAELGLLSDHDGTGNGE